MSSLKNDVEKQRRAGGRPRLVGLALLRPSWPAVLVGTLLLYTFVLVIGTHLPKIGGIVRTPGVDKLLHFGAYFVQATLAAAAVAATGRLGRRNAVILIAALAVFGGLDELTQPWFSRSAEWADWAADCLGIVLGVSLVMLLIRRLNRSAPQDEV